MPCLVFVLLDSLSLESWMRVAAGVVTLVGVLYQGIHRLRAVRLPRSKLKADLEVLERISTTLGRGSDEYQQVRARVNGWVQKMYAEKGKSADIEVAWGNLVLGCLLVLVFAPWAVFQVMKGFHWSIFLTGYGVILGGMLIQSSMDEKDWKALRSKLRFRSISPASKRVVKPEPENGWP